jgi:hypothetical protein
VAGFQVKFPDGGTASGMDIRLLEVENQPTGPGQHDIYFDARFLFRGRVSIAFTTYSILDGPSLIGTPIAEPENQLH